jgi:poly(3-hydroxybutyrate) depolymerase
MKKLVCLCLTVLLTSTIFGIDVTGSLMSNSVSRNFVLHANGASISTDLPMVIALHGDGGSGPGFKSGTNFDAAADANNFMVVYPSATSSLGSGIWNKQIDGNYTGEPNDVLFISDLIDYMCETYQINANKVYVTGHSGGAFMAYHLAVQLNTKIAAFAPVAGSMYDAAGGTFLNNYLVGASFVKVPICHIHGDADNVVGYPDTDFVPVDYQEWPLTAFSPFTCGSLTYENTTTTTVSPGVERINFCTNGASSKEIFLVRLIGKGHSWPNVAGFNVEEYIWNFFNTHQLSLTTTCSQAGGRESDFDSFEVFPNPIVDELRFNTKQNETEFEIVNLAGQVIRKKAINTETVLIDLKEVPNGIYLIRIKNQTGEYRFARFVK